ncbi:uncharacterized protein BJ171DRAFT_576669 [Polychytrium aggregatum]|uniref:uncharacterized protein n=1 Tax=Polychytrium aggregatum TaxID=110093 RepID=UPI0022FDBE2D|nr:uncharacterized protein BJ171DRAFT_576669 [Polychytrium aggregatum]KAI9209864.1 hypothetical protein BJ171DRAFT_576669 [Polychytrium aggregatum]
MSGRSRGPQRSAIFSDLLSHIPPDCQPHFDDVVSQLRRGYNRHGGSSSARDTPASLPQWAPDLSPAQAIDLMSETLRFAAMLDVYFDNIGHRGDVDGVSDALRHLGYRQSNILLRSSKRKYDGSGPSGEEKRFSPHNATSQTQSSAFRNDSDQSPGNVDQEHQLAHIDQLNRTLKTIINENKRLKKDCEKQKCETIDLQSRIRNLENSVTTYRTLYEKTKRALDDDSDEFAIKPLASSKAEEPSAALAPSSSSGPNPETDLAPVDPMELQILESKYNEAQEALDQATEEKGRLEKQLEKLEKNIEGLSMQHRAEVSQLKVRNEDLEKALAETQQELTARSEGRQKGDVPIDMSIYRENSPLPGDVCTKAEDQDSESRVAIKKEPVQSLDDNQSHIIASLNIKIRSLKEANEKANRAINKQQVELDALQKEMESTRHQLHHLLAVRERDNEALHAEFRTARNFEIEKWNNERAALKSEIETLRVQLAHQEHHGQKPNHPAHYRRS